MNFSPVIVLGVSIPFLGTILGSACVFLFKSFSKKTDKCFQVLLRGSWLPPVFGVF